LSISQLERERLSEQENEIASAAHDALVDRVDQVEERFLGFLHCEQDLRAQEDRVSVVLVDDQRKRFFKLLVLKKEESLDALERVVRVCLADLGAKSASLVKLVRFQQSDDTVDFHQSLLSDSQVDVFGQLVLDSLGELSPVQVANLVLEQLHV